MIFYGVGVGKDVGEDVGWDVGFGVLVGIGVGRGVGLAFGPGAPVLWTGKKGSDTAGVVGTFGVTDASSMYIGCILPAYETGYEASFARTPSSFWENGSRGSEAFPSVAGNGR
ncbi:TPA: hypothetical protein DIS60_04975 [Patescibacteria group bacterium]|nr:hypothetical protein [Patescibacteria group bacterium]